MRIRPFLVHGGEGEKGRERRPGPTRRLVTKRTLWHAQGRFRALRALRIWRNPRSRELRGPPKRRTGRPECHRARFVTNLRLQSLARRLGPVCVNDGLTGECCLPSGWRAITEIGKQRGAGRLSESFSSLATRHFLFIVGGQGCNIFRFR